MTRPRRHPSEVTVDRLHAVLDEYSEEMDGATLDAFGLVIFALDNIAQGEKP